MRKGLVISLSLHAAILFWAVAVFPEAEDLTSAQPVPVPVELVTPDEVSKVKAGDKKADKKPPQSDLKPEPPKQAKKETKKDLPERKVARASEPATPPEAAEPAPLPKPKKSAPKPEAKPEKREDKAVAAPMPTRKPKNATKFTEPLKPAKPQPKVADAKPKKKEFNPDDIAALLNKAPDAAKKKVASVEEPQKKPEPAQGLERGQDLRMTLSEIDALRARISQCWNPPVGGLGAEALKVKLRLQLSQDGMLASRPTVVNSGSSPFFQAAADSAVRAVMLCQPYTLPSDKFALWRDMIINFDPRDMIRG